MPDEARDIALPDTVSAGLLMKMKFPSMIAEKLHNSPIVWSAIVKIPSGLGIISGAGVCKVYV